MGYMGYMVAWVKRNGGIEDEDEDENDDEDEALSHPG